MTDILADIQRKLKAPKDKENKFGGYKYRNAEGILAAFKEVQPPDVSLTMSDSIAFIGDRLFLVATVRLHHGGNVIAEAQGAAMHALTKKGMDDAQISGACSSYARKYALCGLFAIDDSTDDPDGKDNRHEEPKPRQEERKQEQPKAPQDQAKAPMTPNQIADWIISRFDAKETAEDLAAFASPDGNGGIAWNKLAKDYPEQSNRVKAAYDKRMEQLQ